MGWFFSLGRFWFLFSDLCPCPGRAGHLPPQQSAPVHVTHRWWAELPRQAESSSTGVCAASSLLSHPGPQDGHLRGSTPQGTRRQKTVPWLSVQGWNNAKSENSCRERMQNHTYLACPAVLPLTEAKTCLPMQGELSHHDSIKVYTYILGPEFRVS